MKKNRGEKLSDVKKIWEGELLTGHEAAGYGLVDGIKNYIDYFDSQYPGLEIKECTYKGYYERVEELVGPFMVRNDFDLVKKKVVYGLLTKNNNPVQ